jgi:PAS domain S-box-containing protein
MNERRPESPQAASLRERAERVFREMLDSSLENLDVLSPETLRASLHELRVHQIELEMQNEDLLRAQAALDASRARYFDLYELAPVGYCTVSEKWQILETNLTAATLFGVERSALVGKSLSDFISKEDQELYYWCRKKLFDTRQPQQCDLRMARHDGTAFFAHLEVTAAKDEADAPVGHVALIDVTARKQAEDALREREAQMRSITESAQDAIIMMDHGGLISYWNPAAEAIFGYRREEALGRNLHGLLVPEPYHSAYRAAHPEFQRTGQGSAVGKTLEMAAIRKDGKEIAVSLSISAVALGGEWHSVGVVRDITAHKMATEASNRLAAIVDSSDDAIIGENLDGTITSWNRGAEKIFGYTSAEMEGTSILRLIPANQQLEEQGILGKIRRGQSVIHFETLRQTKDGELMDVSITASPIRDAAGKIIGMSKVARDITGRKRGEETLRASEARYAHLAEQSSVVAWEVDAQGLYTYVSQVAGRVWGYRPDELVGRKHFYDLHPESGREAFKASAFTAFARKQPFVDLVNAIQTKDGRQLWVSTNGSPIMNAEGTLCGYRGSDTDITERKLAQDALREAHLELEERVKNRTVELKRSNAQLQLLLASTAEAIYGIDTHGDCTFCNPACLRMLGYEREDELLGKNMHWQIHQKHADGTRFPVEECRIFRAFQANEASHVDDEVLWRADGTSFFAEYWSYPQRVDGVAVGAVVTFIDITERMQQEKARRQLTERLALATEAGQVGIWDYDIAANELVWDDQMFALYGITRDQFGGAYSAWTAGLHPDDRERGDQEIQAAISGEKDFDTEFRVVWPAGGIHHIRAMALVQRDADGKPLHMIGTNWDITEHKRAEIAVLQNVERAEEFARLKSRFVSMASHELRTPLANIMLACELLKNFGTTLPAERARSILSGLMTGVSSMVQTINDLLLAGKIDEGKLPFTPARFALLDFLNRCCQEVQPEPPSRIEIAFRDAGLGVTADERLLHHVLKNLLENALKYSPPDTKVELGVEAGPDSLTLSVRDRGIGVPVAEREFLFDAFSRASNVGDKPGSGLGLFIAQKCAQTHGGKMRYAPQPDGSVFSITIPLAATTDLNPDANPDG